MTTKPESTAQVLGRMREVIDGYIRNGYHGSVMTLFLRLSYLQSAAIEALNREQLEQSVARAELKACRQELADYRATIEDVIGRKLGKDGE